MNNNVKEGVFNLGETEDKEQTTKAIEFALLKQEVDNLKVWKCSYEDSQNQKLERMQEENKKERLKFEEKLDKFMEGLTKQISELTIQLNNQKTDWSKRVPWPLMLLVTSLSSMVVYLLTKH